MESVYCATEIIGCIVLISLIYVLSFFETSGSSQNLRPCSTSNVLLYDNITEDMAIFTNQQQSHILGPSLKELKPLDHTETSRRVLSRGVF